MFKEVKVKNNPFMKSISVLGILISISSLFFITACNKNTSNSSQPAVINPLLPTVPGVVAPGCVSCITNGAQMGFLATTDSNNGGRSMYLGLDFYGDATRADFNDPKVPLKYAGIVQAKGLLRVQSLDTSLCNLPPGDYMISTVQAGTWQGGFMSTLALNSFGPSNLRLQGVSAQNGGILLFTFVQGAIYNGSSINGVSNVETARMGGSIKIETFNGMPCHATLLGGTLPIELF